MRLLPSFPFELDDPPMLPVHPWSAQGVQSNFERSDMRAGSAVCIRYRDSGGMAGL
jgi:hypothetical protein